MRRSNDIPWYLLLALAAALPAGAVGEPPDPHPRQTSPAPAPAPGYVADHRCRDCHPRIYDSYSHVGMARSFGPFRADRAIENFNSGHFYHAPSDRHYLMELQDKAMWVTRYREDAQGRRRHALRLKVDFVIGSGLHSRGYLYRTPGGELFEMPIVWYTQTRRWGMAPGYDRPDHEDFQRPISRQCMFCHNAYPSYELESDAFGRPHRFPASLPAGTGCQRCHGPGAEHVRVAEDPTATAADMRATIVNVAALSPRRQMDVCLQCHLQPTSRSTVLPRRFGRGDYAFRPGQLLADYLVPLDVRDGRPREARFEINHHPYRLMQSRCYVSSGERLTCVTCHDPHAVIAPADRAAHYRAACLSCHQQQACSAPHTPEMNAGGLDCAGCHMPKRRTEDVIHVVMTDHRIQRRPPADLLGPRQEIPPIARGPFVALFPDRPEPPEGLALYLATVAAADGRRGGDQALAAELGRARKKPTEPWFQLGISQISAGDFAGARATLTGLIKRHPNMALAHVNLATALAGLGQHPAAATALHTALKLDPQLPEAHLNLGLVLARLGRTVEARTAYEQAIALRPTDPAAHFNLGNLQGRAGQFARAAEHFRRTLTLNPDHVAAHRNLGSALRRLGRWQEALDIWEQGRRLAPSNSLLHRELALAYLAAQPARLRDPDRALAACRRHAELSPQSPSAHVLLSLTLTLHGDAAAANGALQTAKRLNATKAYVAGVEQIMAIRFGSETDPGFSGCDSHDSGDRVIDSICQSLRDLR